MNSTEESSTYRGTASEQYLSLYLGLMISIFCIVLVADNSALSFPTAEQPVGYISEVVGSSPKAILEMPFALFAEDGVTIREETFGSVLAVLRAHDLRAELHLYAEEAEIEQVLAKALALQYRFARERLFPEDVLTEVVIDDGYEQDSTLFLFPDTRAKW